MKFIAKTLPIFTIDDTLGGNKFFFTEVTQNICFIKQYIGKLMLQLEINKTNDGDTK